MCTRALVALLVVMLVGCGTAARTVRLETGQGKPLVHTPRSTELVRDVRPTSNPLRNARQLMFSSPWQEEVFLKWTGQRLVLDSQEAQETWRTPATDVLTSEYGRWCEHTGRSRDCFLLLKEGPNGFSPIASHAVSSRAARSMRSCNASDR